MPMTFPESDAGFAALVAVDWLPAQAGLTCAACAASVRVPAHLVRVRPGRVVARASAAAHVARSREVVASNAAVAEYDSQLDEGM